MMEKKLPPPPIVTDYACLLMCHNWHVEDIFMLQHIYFKIWWKVSSSNRTINTIFEFMKSDPHIFLSVKLNSGNVLPWFKQGLDCTYQFFFFHSVCYMYLVYVDSDVQFRYIHVACANISKWQFYMHVEFVQDFQYKSNHSILPIP